MQTQPWRPYVLVRSPGRVRTDRAACIYNVPWLLMQLQQKSHAGPEQRTIGAAARVPCATARPLIRRCTAGDKCTLL
jgi:hypothetical protein